MLEAIDRAWALGCNPGGEVLGAELGEDVPPALRNRALTREEIADYGESTLKAH